MDGSGPLGRAERGELRVALAARRRSALLQQAAAPRDGRPRRVRLLAFVVRRGPSDSHAPRPHCCAPARVSGRSCCQPLRGAWRCTALRLPPTLAA